MTSSPLFPGGVALSDLQVYDWAAADGCRGGTPHLHTASSEGYVVIGGTGSVQTVSSSGVEEHPLAVGDIVWFSPGTVHRLVNDGDLRLLVAMSNAGLPEAGDAVLTFPSDILRDPDAYAAAAALDDVAGREASARARRDLALAGFEALRAGGPGALAQLHADAARIVQGRVPQWREIWQATVAAETARVDAQLDALAAGEPGGLRDASVRRAAERGPERTHGMCGMLRTWEWPAG
ncbi:cupin domain-containing protein [Microbacterium sp. 179-B 1A2 NHS]|uniref:cupin domain-containing protein n=1 Tax=Microbacterium sp. 179-B 1A2 NHS TaxID=3142383 RepID=UPI0039A2ECEB